MRPPASRMISAPAAMSHLLSPSSKKASTRPAADVAQVERRGAGPAHAGRLEHDHAQHVQVALHVHEVGAIRKTRADQRLLDRRALAHADAAAVELCALAAAGREDLLPQRVVDDAMLELVLCA